MSYATTASAADIDNRFDYHPPSPARIVAHEAVREACRALAHRLDCDLPPSREKALALTNLEQAGFWSNAAIARNADDEAVSS
ncbi:Acb2/Tad1 domain-containing protein [Nocardia asteroides]|uniref:Acb2/Tad1 domain-containing protein n=1 Tax=Nocardia asteroides TaxID=1824 RepID=UPI0033E50B40